MKTFSTSSSFCSSTLQFCYFFIFVLFVSPGVIFCDDEGAVIYEDGLKNFRRLDLPRVVGPESIAFDCNGNGPYVSVSDGRILKWEASNNGWTEFAVTSATRDRKACDGSANPIMEPICGRPLGLKFSPTTCDLYIADAYHGLFVVGPKGGVAKQLVTSAAGVPFRLLNSLDIDTKTGMIYFTDSSLYFQRCDYILSILSVDKTGRLLKYDPNTNKVTILFKGMSFANGLALSNDMSFILLNESGKLRILKFPITGSDSVGDPEIFAQFGRIPDNIKRQSNGEFWVGLNSGRGRIRKQGKTEEEAKEDQSAVQWIVNDPVAIKIREDGKVLKVLEGGGDGALDSVSEVVEHNGSLWIGSSMKPYLGCIKN